MTTEKPILSIHHVNVAETSFCDDWFLNLNEQLFQFDISKACVTLRLTVLLHTSANHAENIRPFLVDILKSFPTPLSEYIFYTKEHASAGQLNLEANHVRACKQVPHHYISEWCEFTQWNKVRTEHRIMNFPFDFNVVELLLNNDHAELGGNVACQLVTRGTDPLEEMIQRWICSQTAIQWINQSRTLISIGEQARAVYIILPNEIWSTHMPTITTNLSRGFACAFDELWI